MVIANLSPRAESLHQAIYTLYTEWAGTNFPRFGLMSDEMHRWAYDVGLITKRELEGLLRYDNFLCTTQYS